MLRWLKLCNLSFPRLDGRREMVEDGVAFTAKSTQFNDEIEKAQADIQTSKAQPLTGFETVLEVFDLAQVAAERWEVLDKAGRREILDTVLLKRTLSDTSLVTTKRKPFDVFAEGLLLKESRGGRHGIETILQRLLDDPAIAGS